MHAQLRKPPQTPIQKNKKNKKNPHRCDGNGTINYICKHTHTHTPTQSGPPVGLRYEETAMWIRDFRMRGEE